MLHWNEATPASNNPNPLDGDLANDPDAQAVWNKARASFGTLSRAFDQLSLISDSLFAKIAQAEADSTRTVEYKAQQVAQIRNQAMETIEALRRTCEKSYANVQLAIKNAQNDASGAGNTADSVYQIERTRDAWMRVQMVLDSVPAVNVALSRAVSKAQEASAERDPDTVRAIYQNLRAYLESRGLEMSQAMIANQLDHAIGATESPAYRAAMQIQNVAATGWINLQMAFDIALGYCKGGDVSRIRGLPGWPGAAPINL